MLRRPEAAMLPSDAAGSAVPCHLRNCGRRLAATAGTDVWLSDSRVR